MSFEKHPTLHTQPFTKMWCEQQLMFRIQIDIPQQMSEASSSSWPGFFSLLQKLQQMELAPQLCGLLVLHRPGFLTGRLELLVDWSLQQTLIVHKVRLFLVIALLQTSWKRLCWLKTNSCLPVTKERKRKDEEGHSCKNGNTPNLAPKKLKTAFCVILVYFWYGFIFT